MAGEERHPHPWARGSSKPSWISSAVCDNNSQEGEGTPAKVEVGAVWSEKPENGKAEPAGKKR